ncbi:MAG: metalloregulator ArsR/SmtB family transcription factor [Desulfobacterales bacterium]|nr:metalloregulator ArsR/SmtB family transcription factor [Desulfobacterales bacterium]
MDIIKQFKALSDPTRLRLLNILNHVELNVNEIVSIVDMIQSGVSRHLKILLEAGLLKSRKEGSFIYYSANGTDAGRKLINLACTQVETDPLFVQDLNRAEQSITVRKNRTKRFFKTVAPQWDRLKKEVLGEFALNRIIEEKVGGGKVLADLGCGTGELLSRMINKGFQTLIGVDASPEMLEQARIKLPDLDSLELRLGEVENLPMRDREVDTVIMSMVLFHLIEPEKSFHEICRVLSPGGTFLLADFQKHGQEEIKQIIGGSWLGFTTEQITNWLSSSGLTLMDQNTFPVEKGLNITLYIAKKESP